MTAPDPMPSARREEVLVDSEWLEAHLGDPFLRVVEVDVGPAAYDTWHIDGAVLWNVYQDLKDHDYRFVGTAAFERLVQESGLEPRSTVVFYGYAPALGFWLLRRFGHQRLYILDCSRDTWRSEGRPWSTSPSRPVCSSYRLGPEDPAPRADRSSVERAIVDPTSTLLDVRSEAEYRGERFWPSGGQEPGGRAGHVPSALHLPIDGVLDKRGAFLSTPELRRLFGSVDLKTDRPLVTYCTIGGRAATAWFVLTHLLGRAGVRVYDDSWAEWGRLPESPVEAA